MLMIYEEGENNSTDMSDNNHHICLFIWRALGINTDTFVQQADTHWGWPAIARGL